jgi:hypothetical protein
MGTTSRLIVNDPNGRDEDDHVVVAAQSSRDPATTAAHALLDRAAGETLFGREPSGEVVRVGGRLGDRGYYLDGGRVYRFRTKSNGKVNSDDLGDSPEVLAAFRAAQKAQSVGGTA